MNVLLAFIHQRSIPPLSPLTNKILEQPSSSSSSSSLSTSQLLLPHHDENTVASSATTATTASKFSAQKNTKQFSQHHTPIATDSEQHATSNSYHYRDSGGTIHFILIDTVRTHNNIRRVVGSIHRYYNSNSNNSNNSNDNDQNKDSDTTPSNNAKIIIYGYRLQFAMTQEIKLWQSVLLIDLESQFMTSSQTLSVSSVDSSTDGNIRTVSPAQKNEELQDQQNPQPETMEETKREEKKKLFEKKEVRLEEDRVEDTETIYVMKHWKFLVINDALNRYDRIFFIDTRTVMSSPFTIPELNRLLGESGTGSIFFYPPGVTQSEKMTVLGHDTKSCLMDAPVILMEADSFAHRHFVRPLIECSRRYCARKEIMALNRLDNINAYGNSVDHHQRALTCHRSLESTMVTATKTTTTTATTAATATTDTGLSKFVRKFNIKTDYYMECDVVMREDFLLSESQLPTIDRFESMQGRSSNVATIQPQEYQRKGSDTTVIAIGFPGTTKGNAKPTVRNNPVIATLLPGLLRTIQRRGADKYHYVLYLGYDEGDSFYDNPKSREEFLVRVKSMIHPYSVDFHMVKCVNSHGWVPFIWNVLFQRAMDDGADYFYQTNDDNRFITPGWSTKFIEVLRASPMYPNMGVTGPVDLRNKRIFTQAFVHRTHYQIFGYMFPPVFKNWFSDNWITYVYEFSPVFGTFRNTEMHAANKQTYGTRYTICENGKKLLERALHQGRERIMNWLEDHK